MYSLPPGSTVANGDTSDATDVNTPLDDIVTDLNTARPIVAGGTGATSVAAAQTALKIPPFNGTATISGAWTFSAAPKLNDGILLYFGTDQDAYIGHSGANWTIRNSTGITYFDAGTTSLRNAAGTEVMALFTANGAVTLYFNDAAKIATKDTGVTITGVATVSAGGSETAATLALGSGSYGFYQATDQILATVAGTQAAIIGPVGTTASAATTVMTREKGDARYNGQDITGVTLSGATDFTGLSGTPTRLTIMFSGVSLDGAGDILVQLGSSGGIAVSGYTSGSSTAAAAATSITGFVMRAASAGSTFHGIMTLERRSGTNNWFAQHGLGGASTGAAGGGQLALGADLTQFRITTTAGTFDAGSVAGRYWR